MGFVVLDEDNFLLTAFSLFRPFFHPSIIAQLRSFPLLSVQ